MKVFASFRVTFESKTYTFDESLGYRWSDQLRLNLSMTQSLSETDGRANDLYQARLMLNWMPANGLTVEPILALWKRRYEQNLATTPNQKTKYLTAGLRVQWRFRNLWMNFSLFRNERTVQLSDVTTDDRVMFKLRRQLL